MNHSAAVSESIEYSKEALIGKWARWITFVILGLPTALMPFVFDMNAISDETTFSWEQVPWGQVAALLIAGILLSFFLSGYLVRIYRGTKPAPDFNDWGALFIEGLKLQIVSFLWLLPVMLLIIIAFGLTIAGIASAGPGSFWLLLALLVVFAILMVLAMIVSLFIPIAQIRFSRTGSIREGLRFSEISAHIGRIGWGQYIIALVVLFAVMLVFGIIVMIFSLIPYIGWVLELIMTPLITVFTARYYTLVYEEGTERPAAA